MKISTIFLALGFGASAAPALAETVDAAAVMSTKSEVNIVSMTEGDMIAALVTTYTGVDAEEGHPMAGSTGQCSGTTHMMGEDVEGGGFCVFETKTGKVMISFTADGRDADGAMVGDWSVVGGTDGWEGASGSGRFASLVDRETGEGTNTVEGSFELQ